MRAFQFCLVVQLMVLAASTQIADYYWRDYNGDVPEDAVLGGRDVKGKPIYIGQGFFIHYGLLPGTLHPGSTTLKVTSVQEVFTINQFVKILCSGHPNNFRWTSVSYSDLALMTDVHFVEGGIETNSVLYIGRIRHEGDLEIGKVYNLAPYQGLALPNKENKETSYNQFDILTYDFMIIDLRYIHK